MSMILYRLGRWCAHKAWKVLAIWFAVLIALGGGAATVGMQLSNDFQISDSEAMDGIAILRERLPQAAGTTEPILITTNDGNIRAHESAIKSFINDVGTIDGIALVTNPFDSLTEAITDGGDAVLVQVQTDTTVEAVSATGGGKAAQVKSSLENAVQVLEKNDPQLDAQLSGMIGMTSGVELTIIEAFGVLLAAIVLLFTFGSLRAAGIPIMTALIGVGVGMCGIIIAASLTDINAVTPVLAIMIGLAVGIDYALFIINRAREYSGKGFTLAESAGRAVATAGSAVVFAGMTVVIALCGLAVARIPFLTAMGVSAAFMVTVAVAVAITAVPAFLGLLGKSSATSSKQSKNSKPRRDEGFGTRCAQGWITMIMKAPIVCTVAIVVILGVCAIPIKGVSLSLVGNGYEPRGTQMRETYDAIAETFGEGYNAPIIVIADIVQSTDPLNLVENISSDLEKLDGVAQIALATPNPDASLGFFQIIPQGGQDSPETTALVEEIRKIAPDLERQYGISDVMVTGMTAVAIDVANTLDAALLPFGIVVVGLSLILLTIVFRSFAVPITATFGYILSLGAGMGAVGAMFGWGWLADAFHVTKVGSVISFLPVIVMGILFGLAMDYEVFLVSRMRETWIRTGDARRAVFEGFTGSAKVVTAAALIMTSVFAFFIPEGNKYIKPIAVALTVGIFTDAFLVRMTFIPAIMTLLGKKAWWIPRFLDRLLPMVDVEGSGLARDLEHQDWQSTHGLALVRVDNAQLCDDQGIALHPISLVLRNGEFGYIRIPETLDRETLAAVINGRIQTSDGIVVINNHVLPEGKSAVQVETCILRFPDPDFVGSRVKVAIAIDPMPSMWSTLAELHERGVAALAIIGSSVSIPQQLQHLVRDISGNGTSHRDSEIYLSEHTGTDADTSALKASAQSETHAPVSTNEPAGHVPTNPTTIPYEDGDVR